MCQADFGFLKDVLATLVSMGGVISLAEQIMFLLISKLKALGWRKHASHIAQANTVKEVDVSSKQLTAKQVYYGGARQ